MLIWKMKPCCSLFLGGLRGGHPEEDEAHDEEAGDGAYADLLLSGDLGEGAHDQRAHDGSALAADIEEAEILAGLL